jgi:hypothetical protein
MKWDICNRKKGKEPSKIEILNMIYKEGTERISNEFSLEKLIRSTREMKVYMKT